MEDKNTIEQIKIFLSFLYLKHPFYNSLLTSIDIKLERTELSKKYYIYSKSHKSINIDFDFANNLIIENKKVFFYYIIHELLHIILKHKLRSKNKNFQKWQLATDITIDDIIKKDNILTSLIEIPNNINRIISFNNILNAEEIYKNLDDISEDENVVDENNSNDSNNDDFIDNENFEEKQSNNNNLNINHLNNHEIWNFENSEITNNIEKQIDEMLIQAFQKMKLKENNKKEFGGSLGFFEEQILELLKPKTSLLEYINKNVQNFKHYRTTYKRPDRRYLYNDLIVPSKTKNIKHFKLLFYIDTSGSVETTEIQKILSELYYIINSLDSFEIDIIQSDAGIQENYKITNKEKINLDKFLKIKGRGGTEFKPLFKHLENENYDLILVSSDYFIDKNELNELEKIQNENPIGFVVTKNYNKESINNFKNVFHV